MRDQIVTDTRTTWRDRALEAYREIEAEPLISAELRERARQQRYQLEHEAPLLDWEAA